MSTVNSIVDDLGRKALAARLNVRLTAISNAVVAGSFPSSWYLPLALMGKEAGIEVPVSLFRWRSVDAHSLQDCVLDCHVSSGADDT